MKKETIHNNSTRRKSTILLSIGAILTMLIMTSANVRAAAVWPSNIDTESNAAIVMEAKTGAILYEKNIDTQYYPASITKILTTLLAIENSNLNEVVTFSYDAVFKNEGDSSHIGRDLDEQMTMEQCLYAVMLESANECAYAVAEHVGGGDVNKFITMMNDKAKKLGCTHTHFSNPNGLPDPNHYTSARDMALISKAAYENKIFDKITGTKTYTIPPTNKHAEPTLLNNHHAMLNFYQTNRYLYEPCVGGKTGYTQDAGATLVTYAKKDGMTLIAVVLNGETSTYYVDTTNILNYCFDNFTAYDLSSESGSQVDGRVGKLGSLNNDKKYIMRGENSTVILPRTADFSETTYKLVPSDDKGDVVGQVQYYYADRFVGSADLIFEKAKSVPYPFHNIDSEQGGSSVSYFRIDIKVIVIILIGLFITYLLLLFMRAKSGRILLKKKRKRDSKRKVEPRYTVIDRDRYRRRRRRRR
mgnify:CR=1 FL=1